MLVHEKYINQSASKLRALNNKKENTCIEVLSTVPDCVCLQTCRGPRFSVLVQYNLPKTTYNWDTVLFHASFGFLISNL